MNLVRREIEYTIPTLGCLENTLAAGFGDFVEKEDIRRFYNFLINIRNIGDKEKRNTQRPLTLFKKWCKKEGNAFDKYLEEYGESKVSAIFSNLSPFIQAFVERRDTLFIKGIISFEPKEKQDLGEGVWESSRTCIRIGGQHGTAKAWLVQADIVGVIKFTLRILVRKEGNEFNEYTEGKGRGLIIPLSDNLIALTNFYLPPLMQSVPVNKQQIQQSILQEIHPQKIIKNIKECRGGETAVSQMRLPLYLNSDFTIWGIGDAIKTLQPIKVEVPVTSCVCGERKKLTEIEYNYNSHSVSCKNGCGRVCLFCKNTVRDIDSLNIYNGKTDKLSTWCSHCDVTHETCKVCRGKYINMEYCPFCAAKKTKKLKSLRTMSDFLSNTGLEYDEEE